jgi:hypothetical protein
MFRWGGNIWLVVVGWFSLWRGTTFHFSTFGLKSEKKKN